MTADKAWINVKDRLPETEGRFLVVVMHDIVMIAGWDEERGFVAANRESRVMGVSSRTVSHWMPVPDPPPIEIRLSDRDRDIFLAMLDSDEEPNEALKQAAEEYKKRIREGTLISEND